MPLFGMREELSIRARARREASYDTLERVRSGMDQTLIEQFKKEAFKKQSEVVSLAEKKCRELVPMLKLIFLLHWAVAELYEGRLVSKEFLEEQIKKAGE